jgi:hypothetical protein
MLLLSGCKVRGASDIEKGRAVSPAPRVLVKGAQALVNPGSLVVAGRFLVVGDDAESFIKVFDRNSGSLVATAGRRGSGPGEFTGIWSLQAVDEGNSDFRVWGYDPNQLRLVGYELNRDGQPTYISPQVVLQSTGNPTSAQWVSPTMIAAVGLFHEARFILFDTAGRLLEKLGTVPLASDKFPIFAAQQALQPTLTVHPDGTRLAVASRYAGRVDIYDTSDGTSLTVKVPLPFDPPVSLAQRGNLTIFVSDQQTRFGYVGISSTKDRIFALFSGRTRAEYPGRAFEGSQVHVFKWTGEFEGAIELGTGVLAIGVDMAGEAIYAIVTDPAPAVWAYDITTVGWSR